MPVWSPNLPIITYEHWKKEGIIPDRLLPQKLPYELADCTLDKIARDAGARFISLHNILCDDRGCLTHTSRGSSDLLIYDYGHLTVRGAEFVADLIWDHSSPPKKQNIAPSSHCDAVTNFGG